MPIFKGFASGGYTNKCNFCRNQITGANSVDGVCSECYQRIEGRSMYAAAFGRTTECMTCGGGTGQTKPCQCGVVVSISSAGRAALEADKLAARSDFVTKFIADRLNTGKWPDNEVTRVVMMVDLIEAWENRKRDR